MEASVFYVCLVLLLVQEAHVNLVLQAKVIPPRMRESALLVLPVPVLLKEVSVPSAPWVKSPILVDNVKTARQALAPSWVDCVNLVLLDNHLSQEVSAYLARKVNFHPLAAFVNPVLQDTVACLVMRLVSLVVWVARLFQEERAWTCVPMA